MKINLHFKALLLLSNAPETLLILSLNNSNIKVIFLPPTTTSLLQQTDQGLYQHAARATDSSNTMSLLDFWRSYSIHDCLKVIKELWDGLKTSIVQLARQIGGGELDDMRGRFP